MFLGRPAVIVFSFLSLLAIPSASALDLSIQGQTPKISGAATSASVAWFGVETYPVYSAQRIDITATELQASKTGTVDATPVLPHSVWAAVDLSTGAFRSIAPSGSPARIEPLAHTALGHGPDGKLAAIGQAGASVVVLLVRPNAGAWTTRVSDGGPNDGDGKTNGGVVALLTGFTPVGATTGTPGELLPNDVIVAINTETLRLTAGRVATILGGAQ